jgi:hypothetical protein
MRVFISHQWTDKQLADRLARDLEPFADVWMDYRKLRPGDAIQSTIDSALEDTDLVLVVWTENASRSQGVAAEIRSALARGVRVVPCIFSYDDFGNPNPRLPSELAGILGVDFHHHGTGVAQIAGFIVDLERERLPSGSAVKQHPGIRMLEYLRGYLSYLANYRRVRGVSDDRAQWVDRIIDEVERYLTAGGNAETVRALLDAARNSTVSDAEGTGMLVTRLDASLANHTSPAAGAAPLLSPFAAPRSGQRAAWQAPAPPPQDELARRVAQAFPHAAVADSLAGVDTYIAAAPVALRALDAYARSAESRAGCEVVQFLEQYLANADDLIPSHHGRYGLLDDSWLILNTAFRLIESGLLPVSAVPIDWQTIVESDSVVQAIIPPEALEALSVIVLQLLQTIAAEVQSYQPWFTPQGQGYAPTIAAPRSRGGTWEDQMNEVLRGTGLSV